MISLVKGIDMRNEQFKKICFMIKNLKREIKNKNEEMVTLFEQLRLLEIEKQELCNHPENKIEIRNNSYVEEGRMSAPYRWQEKFCKECGKVLAKRGEKTEMTEWHS